MLQPLESLEEKGRSLHFEVETVLDHRPAAQDGVALVERQGEEGGPVFLDPDGHPLPSFGGQGVRERGEEG